MTELIPLAIAAVLGYGFGCIPVANLVAARRGVADLRATGDRNPGYWNARRVLGVREAVPILLLDAAKGAAAAGVGLLLAGVWGGIAGWAGVVIGHMFPATMRFRGGRSLLCLAGGAIVMAPVPCAIAGIALILVRQIAGFARGIQVAVVVTPVAIAVVQGPGPVLAATVVLLLAVGVRAALADRALRRAGIDKDAIG